MFGVMKLSDRNSLEEAPEVVGELSNRIELDGANAELPKSIGPADAPRCEAACRTEFTKGMGIDPVGDPAHVLESLCRKISEDYLSLWFWDLYCCDSKYCGVDVTESGFTVGLDPQVDDILGRCAGIGIRLVDPGPPPVARCDLADENPFKIVSTPSESNFHNDFTMQIETRIIPVTAAATLTTGGTGSLVSVTSISSSDATFTSAPSTSSLPSLDELDTGGKIAICICAAVAALAMIFALLCLRKRRRISRGYTRNRADAGDFISHDHAPSASCTSLIRPPTTAASKPLPSLTPPMRLGDRKFLPSVLDAVSVRSSSAPPYSSQPDVTSTKHRVLASKALPHCEPQATLWGIRSKLPGNAVSNHPRNSVSSVVSAPRTVSSMSEGSMEAGSSTSTSAIMAEPETPPLSPMRPRRPHDFPLEIPGLVTPSKPLLDHAVASQLSFQFQLPSSTPISSPPNPYLSAISPISPLSPTLPGSSLKHMPQPVSPMRPPGEVGADMEVIRNSPAGGMAPLSHSHGMCKLAHAHSRERQETRTSWGSWSGAGSGARWGAAKRKGDGPQSSGNGEDGDSGASAGLIPMDLAKLRGSH